MPNRKFLEVEGLRLIGPDGPAAELRINKQGPELVLFDSDGDERVKVGIMQGQIPCVRLIGENRTAITQIHMDRDACKIMLTDQHGKPVFLFPLGKLTFAEHWSRIAEYLEEAVKPEHLKPKPKRRKRRGNGTNGREKGKQP